ncbi:MAG: DNA repair protein RecO [Candidatus Melainabacteria bacterium]|nr:DNA repair protein RecO [Candidatus Melainabacteria bacterium]
MTTYPATFICLRTWDYGDADRIVHAFSPEHGLIRLFVKGARKTASKLAGACDVLHVSEALIFKGASGQFQRLCQYDSVCRYDVLRSDLAALACALVAAELIQAVLVEHDHYSQRLYELLIQLLDALEKAVSACDFGNALPACVCALTHFQTRLLSVAGYEPQLDTCIVSQTPLDWQQPHYAFSVPLGGVVAPESMTQIPSHTGLVRISTQTLRFLHTPPPVSELFSTKRALQIENLPLTLEKSQRFLHYYWTQQLEKPLRAFEMLQSLLNDQLAMQTPPGLSVTRQAAVSGPV